jgi:hypothetical protein
MPLSTYPQEKTGYAFLGANHFGENSAPPDNISNHEIIPENLGKINKDLQ